ncbi:MAG: glycosyltransferase family 1 protein [Acutalibacteraceae bacterium]
MEPVRVLHVLHSMNCGGAETLLMHLYRNMDTDKVQFDFLVNVFDEMFYEKEIGALGGRIYRMPFLTKVTPPVYEYQLYKFFKLHPYTVVHSHLETTTGLILRAARRAGVPVRVAHSHNSRFTRTGITALPENMFKAYCRTKIVPNATKLYGCSELANTWLYGKHAPQSELLNNGIDTAACAFDPRVRAQMRSGLHLGDSKVFGHVGRFNDQKNHTFLIDTFAAYCKAEPNSVLLLVGEGVLEPQIRAQAQAAGVADSVRFLGLRKDVPQLLQAMDVFLLPSKFEGLPLVLVEAQAAGLSCLAADTVSPMADLSAGYFRFVPLESEAWVQAMGEAPVERSADAAPIVAARGFDSRTQARKLQDFYLQGREEV